MKPTSRVQLGAVVVPTGAIVHVRDWHVAADQADYDRHLEDVEAVQAEQVELLRELLKRGYRTAGVEGEDRQQ